MDVFELRDLCRRCQKDRGRDDADVYLSVPGRWGKRTYAPLFGRNGGPRGRIVGDVIPSDPPRCMAVFKADAVIEALSGKGRRI